jgi:hypothetical protein
MKKVLFFIIISLISINIFPQEKELFSDKGHIYFQDQEYYLMIILVNDLRASLDIWNVPNVTPKIDPTTATKINEPISLLIIYAVNKDDINLIYNLRIRNPNGTISGEDYNDFIISNRVRNKKIMYTAAQLPTIIFDEKDERGKYYFIIEIFDYNKLLKTFVLEFNVE